MMTMGSSNQSPIPFLYEGNKFSDHVPRSRPSPPRQSPLRDSGLNASSSSGVERQEVRNIEFESRVHGGPSAHTRINSVSESRFPQASTAEIEGPLPYTGHSRTSSADQQADPVQSAKSEGSQRVSNQTAPNRPRYDASTNLRHSQLFPAEFGRSGSPIIVTPERSAPHSRQVSNGSSNDGSGELGLSSSLQYFHQATKSVDDIREAGKRMSKMTIDSTRSDSPSSMSNSGGNTIYSSHRRTTSKNDLLDPRGNRNSPGGFSSASESAPRDRGRSPQLSPHRYARTPSTQGRLSPETRPMSYADLLNVPYPQPAPSSANLDHTHLQTAVGNNASLLSTKKTLDMYRANVKKTNDPAIQYEFAVFMIGAAQEAKASEQDDQDPASVGASDLSSRSELLQEARHILQRLSDRSYPFAQYYLADGFASGLLNKGREDNDRAFPLFVAAAKHGHAEAGYRTALCYEFGWGTRKDPPKAVQFYRQSASKNHPGAMTRLGVACLNGDMGLSNRYREGLKWLKRAAESADFQYNSAPYELGLLHEHGDGGDVFQDPSYTAQLFTQSADLGHAQANFRLGDAYEHGKLTCPKDPALSLHFYNGAAQQGHSEAMMALCAWYMVGAEPVLEKDENEAYEWARKAAECGTYRPFFRDLDLILNIYLDPLIGSLF